MKIAILSDTHGLLREEVQDIIDRCDAIIHAGDINTREIVNRLQKNAPLYIVRGNNDRAWAMDLPEARRFELAGIHFYLVHNKKDVPKNLDDIDIIIFGHTHQYFEKEQDGRLWFNPGSCGRRRFHQDITLAVMYAENGNYQIEKIEIEQDQNKERQSEQSQPKKKMKKVEEVSKEKAVSVIMEGLKKGESISKMAEKLNISEKNVEEIARIIITHPTTSKEGIIDKMEVNRLQEKKMGK